MDILIGMFIAFGLVGAYLLFRYLRVRRGLKDKNYGGIQRSPRMEPTKEVQEEFLPGSFMDRSFIDEIHKELQGGLKVSGDEKSKARRGQRVFFTKKDVIRSYIVDTLLDKPKWDE